MRETIDSSAEPSVDQETFANRKLIRPSFPRNEHNHNNHVNHGQPMERRERNERPGGGAGKKMPPPETTNAENFYYQKQMQSKTPMVVVLRDGEEVHGTIEWYDKCCLKLIRNGQPNVMIYKPAIKYMYKEGEGKSSS